MKTLIERKCFISYDNSDFVQIIKNENSINAQDENGVTILHLGRIMIAK